MIREWVTRHRRKTFVLAVVSGVAIALIVLFAPVLVAVGTVILIPVAGWLITHVEQAEKWGGRTLELFSFASGRAERVGLSAEMQGVINGARERLQGELPDVMPAPVRVKFVRTPDDLAQLQNGEVVISLQNPTRRPENTARATLGYVTTITIRPARPYVGRDVMAGVDYSITKRILRAADSQALDYFLSEIWEPEMRQRGELRSICAEVEAVERHGLLTRVLLAEFLDLGRRLFGEYPTPEMHNEARELLAYTAAIASRTRGQAVPLAFRNLRTRIGVVLVGERQRVEREGLRPYVRACEWEIRRGVDTIYLLGRGARRDLVEQAAAQMESNGRVLAVDISHYEDEGADGVVAAVCARLSIARTGRIGNR